VILDARVEDRAFRVDVSGTNGRYGVTLDGCRLEVDFQESADGFASLLIDGRSHEAAFELRAGGYAVALRTGIVFVGLAEPSLASAPSPKDAGGAARVTAPMPGKLVRVLVEVGQAVEAAQGLVVMEAMKMENELRSPKAGRVREVHVREGQAVEGGALLVVVD
jgi:biotin carboxyl carrier protein